MKRKSTDTRNAVLPGDPTVDYPYELPYGLKPERGVLVPDEDKAQVVTRIFTSAGNGESAETIANALNDDDVESPFTGQPWTAEMIEAILRNPAYVGEWGGFGRLEKALVEPEVFESAQASAAG
jgi:Recombinase